LARAVRILPDDLEHARPGDAGDEGDVGERQSEGRKNQMPELAVARRRQEPELHRHHEDQHDAEPEDGERLPEQRNDTQHVVDPAVLSQRGDDPHGNRHGNGDGQSRKGEFERRRKIRHDERKRRGPPPIGHAEIAGRELLQVNAELHPERFMHPKRDAHLLDLVGRRHVGEHQGRRIAGDDAQDDE
jgi:hypothetical protein